jgi:hypothetical protein
MKIFDLITEILGLCIAIMLFTLGLLIIWDSDWKATSLGGGISIFSLLGIIYFIFSLLGIIYFVWAINDTLTKRIKK